MTPQELRALALFTQLTALSPDDDDVDARITIRLGNGKFMGDVLLSSRDMEAVTDAVASLNAYAQAARAELAQDAVQELNPVALAQLMELDITDLDDTDGGA